MPDVSTACTAGLSHAVEGMDFCALGELAYGSLVASQKSSLILTRHNSQPVCRGVQILLKVYKALGTDKDYIAFSQRFRAIHPGTRPGALFSESFTLPAHSLSHPYSLPRKHWHPKGSARGITQRCSKPVSFTPS